MSVLRVRVYDAFHLSFLVCGTDTVHFFTTSSLRSIIIPSYLSLFSTEWKLLS
jgi:hypothetical protein